MNRSDIEGLDSRRNYWVAAVVAPHRNWAGSPGCRSGARFLVDGETCRANRDRFETFDSELGCLNWIMGNRARLNQALAGARVRAVPLDRWLLGLD
ncbi:MAG: hypothetical protein E6G94_00645 [Alphaproteobacteria bacterium]|nr:MAG: hypothetical protein E6G94_00645 [Alphaproteobacteria bacterium]